MLYKSSRSFYFRFITTLFSLPVLLFLVATDDTSILYLMILPTLMSIYAIYKYYKTIPSVTICDSEIIIDYLSKKEHVFLSDITGFILSDSFPISKVISYRPFSGFAIITNTGQAHVFYEKFYKNPHELRSIFAQITNKKAEPRKCALDNHLTIFNSQLSLKTNFIIFAIALILSMVIIFVYISAVLITIALLLNVAFFVITYDDIRYHLTIEIEGKTIRFKRIYPFSKIISEDMDNIIFCNISYIDIHNGYTGYSLTYLTSDYKRFDIKGNNIAPKDWDDLISILDRNGVPIADDTYEG